MTFFKQKYLFHLVYNNNGESVFKIYNYELIFKNIGIIKQFPLFFFNVIMLLNFMSSKQVFV